jgi:replication initiation and membrane attachment protein DnaB
MRIRSPLTLLLFITFVIASANSASAETVTVITKQNAIRESCKFFSPVKATVHYNDVLDVISQSGEWYQVSFKGTQGCIHKSAVEKKSISLSKISGSESQSTSGDEVALAGKGFNPQVESAYKRANPGLNFQAVNTIENYRVSENKLINFIQGGKLNLE